MKRDMDMIRSILLAVNEHDEPFLNKPELEGYSQELVNYHINLLVQAEYLTGDSFPDRGSKLWFNIALTWKGHEFIDDAQNEVVWEQVKQAIAEKGGNVSLAVLSSLIISVTKQSFGLS